ncbi:uncharacterized protein [Temnothorax nylanderi]|uniref:uncharacterized protein n=1 Tax=Temnothorax nylanderi TaxID=102681 RepID=UPI003A8B9DEC
MWRIVEAQLRPDIAYAVNFVSQFLEKPLERHWMMVKRILKYLQGTTAYGIKYRLDGDIPRLTGYSDADFANDPDTRRSVSGILFKYNGGVITWASRRQQSVALSTMEAEYVAASEGAKKAVWLGRLFSKITPLHKEPVIFIDNASAIKLAKNPSFHKHSKHIAVRYHFVRECVETGQLIVEYIPSEKQVADILTKPIPRVFSMRNCVIS